MKIKINEEEAGITHVSIEGRLDTLSSHDFEKQILPLATPQANILLDCSAFEYISSSGLRQFLLLQKAVIASEGQLTIRDLKPEIREVFDMTGFSALFTFEFSKTKPPHRSVER